MASAARQPQTWTIEEDKKLVAIIGSLVSSKGEIDCKGWAAAALQLSDQLGTQVNPNQVKSRWVVLVERHLKRGENEKDAAFGLLRLQS